MYCIECGVQIPDKSNFCPHCGKKQIEEKPSLKEKIAEVIIEKKITGQVGEAHKSSIDYQFLKKAMGWYLAWVILHLGFLLIFAEDIFGGDQYHSTYFWPFGDERLKCYDIREFLVYTIFPLAILFIISMIQNDSQQGNQKMNSEE